MSLRRLVSLISLSLIALLILLAWKDIQRAWELLGQVNLLVLSLIIPAQIFSYYASGAALTSYLSAKGNLKHVSDLEILRFALEFNFVNHILPTAGVSGLSYATWRFKKLGVIPSRTMFANVIRAVSVFAVFLLLLLVAVFVLAIGGDVSGLLLVAASSMTTLILVGVLLVAYIVVSRTRSRTAGRQSARFINLIGRHVLRRNQPLVMIGKVEDFFQEMHGDYLQLHKEPAVLKRPVAWAAAFVLFELVMFFVVFAAFGYFVNPAGLLIAYGVAAVAGMVAATPGGAGLYEAVMIAVLANTGVPGGVAIAGVLLARVILLLMTLATGYIFYQLTLTKYGKKRTPSEPIG